MGVVHVAVTRQVKLGCEEKFEQALREFARESLREPGTTGVHLIEPVPGTIVNVFVVVTLTWVVMPLITKLFAGWLGASNKK